MFSNSNTRGGVTASFFEYIFIILKYDKVYFCYSSKRRKKKNFKRYKKLLTFVFRYGIISIQSREGRTATAVPRKRPPIKK